MVDPRLISLAKDNPKGEAAVIITLADKVPVDSFTQPDRRSRQTAMIKALKDKAAKTQGDLVAALKALGAKDLRELWLINAVAARVPGAAVAEVASRPAVAEVRLDEVLQAPECMSDVAAPLEWNLLTIRVRDVWEEGLTGRGIVVGSLDTGVDVAHPDLASSWRGGPNSWYDPYGQHATPFDASGHGTQTLGIIVGGSAGGTAIGVAPGSRWIAGKAFNDAGQGQASRVHLAFQWLLDPDGVPQTPDAADVVNASWGYGTSGACVTEFEADIAALRAAGIPVVFAAGNSGPLPGSSQSPGNNPGAVAVGAVNQAGTVATFSSRGPSACASGTFPTVVAPGVSVRTTDLSYGGFLSYVTLSGTSLAAPHVAGTMALLLGARPDASVGAIESAVARSARDLGLHGVDDDYGNGLLDVERALRFLSDGEGRLPVITSTPVTAATAGAPYTYQVTAADPDGERVTISLDIAPTGMGVNGEGLITWTPAGAQAGGNDVRVRATDPVGSFTTQAFTVAVDAANRHPVAVPDSYTAIAGGTLKVSAPGVLGNDTDPDGDALAAELAGGPSRGSLTLAADGALTFLAYRAGTATFSYFANDARLASAPATVTITVAANRRPIATDDAVATQARTAVVIAVLANDSDPDTALDGENKVDPATVLVTSSPDHGGKASVASAGAIDYTPAPKFTGTERFSYAVGDTRGATSNQATVTVTVSRP